MFCFFFKVSAEEKCWNILNQWITKGCHGNGFAYLTAGVPSSEWGLDWDGHKQGHKCKHQRTTGRQCEVIHATNAVVFHINEPAEGGWVQQLCCGPRILHWCSEAAPPVRYSVVLPRLQNVNRYKYKP